MVSVEELQTLLSLVRSERTQSASDVLLHLIQREAKNEEEENEMYGEELRKACKRYGIKME